MRDDEQGKVACDHDQSAQPGEVGQGRTKARQKAVVCLSTHTKLMYHMIESGVCAGMRVKLVVCSRRRVCRGVCSNEGSAKRRTLQLAVAG